MGQEGLGLWHGTVMVLSPSMDLLQTDSARCETMLESARLLPIRERLHKLSSFCATVPGSHGQVARWSKLRTQNLSDLAPLRTVWQGEPINAHLSEQTGVQCTALMVLPTRHLTPYFFTGYVGDLGHLAIIGPSGGGKTTLMKVLLGLLDPTEGEVKVEGVGHKNFGVRTFRHRIGAVLQDDRLLAGTIADNVSFFDADLDMAKVEECLAKACVLDDILKMPMGTMTLVGDLGSTLSGGQQQRVLLARALYREPTILFLDEGTANLDPETEARVSETLRGLSCTRIFVAHREAAIAGADRTLLVAGGTVTELTEQAQVAAE
jgi:ABC-type transport system involved in cytochrome bd biosynthesis fused ATPase/permease subunit